MKIFSSIACLCLPLCVSPSSPLLFISCHLFHPSSPPEAILMVTNLYHSHRALDWGTSKTYLPINLPLMICRFSCMFKYNRLVQGCPKPCKTGFENVTHQVPPPHYSVCRHSSWIKRSEQLSLVRWGSCADLLKKEAVGMLV